MQKQGKQRKTKVIEGDNGSLQNSAGQTEDGKRQMKGREGARKVVGGESEKRENSKQEIEDRDKNKGG